jgi:ubiquinone/menaquinone biosynthesis C-methylase UbiE
MRNLLDEDGFQFLPGQRIMELGCAAGRMLRCFSEEAKNSEVWGTDISSEHIIWCQQNLSPPFNFFTNTTAAHLPFPDSYFDLIYAGSVFTHISEL